MYPGHWSFGESDSLPASRVRLYDAFDRALKVTSVNHATPGQGTVQNEIQNEHGPYGTISKIYQEWAGAVNLSTSKYVQYN